MLPEKVRDNILNALLTAVNDDSTMEDSSSNSSSENNAMMSNSDDDVQNMFIPRIDNEDMIDKTPAIVLLHDTLKMIEEARNFSTHREEDHGKKDYVFEKENTENSKLKIKEERNKNETVTKSRATFKRFVQRKGFNVDRESLVNEVKHNCSDLKRVQHIRSGRKHIDDVHLPPVLEAGKEDDMMKGDRVELGNQNEVPFQTKIVSKDISNRTHSIQWECKICSKTNSGDHELCAVCGRQRGYQGIGKKSVIYNGPPCNKAATSLDKLKEADSSIGYKEKSKGLADKEAIVNNIRKQDMFLKHKLDYDEDNRNILVDDINGLLSSLRNNHIE